MTGTKRETREFRRVLNKSPIQRERERHRERERERELILVCTEIKTIQYMQHG